MATSDKSAKKSMKKELPRSYTSEAMFEFLARLRTEHTSKATNAKECIIPCNSDFIGSYSLFKKPFRLYKKRGRQREEGGKRRTNELKKDICPCVYVDKRTQENKKKKQIIYHSP